VNSATGKYQRRLEDEDFTCRKHISFLHKHGSTVIAGFGAPLGAAAKGNVAIEQELGRRVQISDSQRDDERNIYAPAWGAECFTTYGQNLIVGTDIGKIVVWDLDGVVRYRIMDLCELLGERAGSFKIQALIVQQQVLFVAIHRHTSFEGSVFALPLAEDISPDPPGSTSALSLCE